MNSKRINCGECRFFEVTGFEDFYNIGNCRHPNPQPGGAVFDVDRAEWLTCYQAKRKRRGTKKAA